MKTPSKKTTGNKAVGVYLPAVTSILNADISSPWNTTVLQDTNVRKSSSLRNQIIFQLEKIWKMITDVKMDINEALELKIIEVEELTHLYQNLTLFLNQDSTNARILLYFPFELIPQCSEDISETNFNDAVNSFRKSYLQVWISLLNDIEFSANFTDGDIPEDQFETGSVRLVVKAAQLIPTLIRKGILSYQDALELLREDLDPVLRESINDTLPFLIEDISKFESKSTNRALNEIFSDFSNEMSESQINVSRKNSNRAKWLKQRTRELLFDKYVKEINPLLLKNEMLILDLLERLKKYQIQDEIMLGLLVIEKTVVASQKNNLPYSMSLYELLYSKITEYIVVENDDLLHVCQSILSRLRTSLIAPKHHLDILGVDEPSFSQSASCERLMKTSHLTIANALTSCPELMTLIFPVIVACGSQVKGYGNESSDTDFAIFIRPETKASERSRLHELIFNRMEKLGLSEQAFEFWTWKDGQTLLIQNTRNSDRLVGNSFLTHLLFACPWIGEKESVRLLYDQLLRPYFKKTDEEYSGHSVRKAWLNEIERASLQYRLMHRGYHLFYTEHRSSVVPQGMIDSQGAFWDAGYRRVATKLFLETVFLPELTI